MAYGSLSKTFVKLTTSAWNFLFPITCIGCKKQGFYLCADCSETIPLAEHYVFSTNTIKNLATDTFLGVMPAARYSASPLLKKAIHLFKYRRIKSLAEPLGTLMHKRLEKFFINNSGEWLIVPIPLHQRKECSRGFNQNTLLTAHCFKKCTYPFIQVCAGKNNPLQRIRDVQSQTKLTGMQRITNVKNIFRLSDANAVKNKRVILIDDVITTGATLKEAAATLAEGGAKLVWGCVLAED